MSEINNIHARLKRAFEKRGVDFSSDGEVNDTNPILYQRAFNILKRKGVDFSTPSGHPSFDELRGTNGRNFPYQKVPNVFIANPSWNGYTQVEFGDSEPVQALKFTANAPSELMFYNDRGWGGEDAIDMEISTDNGGTWTAYTPGDVITLSNAGKSVLFRGNNPNGLTNEDMGYSFKFDGTGSVAASGDVMYLLDKTGGATEVPRSGFQNLFSDPRQEGWLTSAPEISATTVGDAGCANMFKDCINLVNAPELPATTLGAASYQSMFENCTSLVTAPELPATTLASECYASMFSNCVNLVNAPSILPAINLVYKVGCYRSMFINCVNLVNAPELPAATLSSGCYNQMFAGCKSLVTAPELPATTLASECYASMFSNCKNLVNAPSILPATRTSSLCYHQMFNGCDSLINAPEISAMIAGDSSCTKMFANCISLVTAPALPATSLTFSCYSFMFQNCESLVNAPALPATALTNYCYSNMFNGCKSLVNAPALPATTMYNSCYKQMFSGCESLITAPELPATTLANNCYNLMFSKCSNLARIKLNYNGALPAANGSTTDWLAEVAPSGDIYFNGTCTERGNSSVPSGWTIRNS